MTRCFFCNGAIKDGEEINLHHPTYKSDGGTAVEPAHKACHVAHHSNKGDFKTWGRQGGRLSAITCAWAFTLRNVRNHPSFEPERAFYRHFYAH